METDQGQFGIKQRCVFNDLQSFHAVGGFPLDPLHDFMERVGAFDALFVLRSLIGEGHFTLQEYNTCMSNVKLADYESSDRPPPVKENHDKLPGKAMAVSLHIKLMPFALWWLMKEKREMESDLLDLVFIIHNINEYILADALSLADSEEFENLMVEFFSKRKTCGERYPGLTKVVCKHHFMEHYADQIVRFGPFTSIWTARCESRHRDFVNFSESSKNFINVLKTLAIRNQKKMSTR